MGQEVKTVQDFLEILKRRKWSILVTAATVFVMSALLAFLLPPQYRSSSTILIEDQEVPRDFVNTTVTSYADQRLQTINQRIMGTDRLLEIIRKFNLYPELRVKWTTEEIVAKMRKDIKLNTISADVIDPRSGMPRPATIAFTLSYQGKSAQVVQQVAGELASLYLSENLATRERQSQGTSTFMEEEMKQIKAKLADTDAKIAVYKKQHVNALPELAQANLQIAESAEQEIVRLNEQLRSLRERESSARSRLESISTDAASQDKARLAELRVKLGELKTRLTDEHPDVIKTRRELAEVSKQLQAAGRGSADNKPDNVAYITLSSELAGVQSEIDSARRQITSFTRKRDQALRDPRRRGGVPRPLGRPQPPPAQVRRPDQEVPGGEDGQRAGKGAEGRAFLAHRRGAAPGDAGQPEHTGHPAGGPCARRGLRCGGGRHQGAKRPHGAHPGAAL